MVVKFGLNPQMVFDQLEQAMDRGEIIRMDPRQLVANILSMCIFPFAARPILSFVMFNNDQAAVEAFFAERATVIKKFVINAIEIKNQLQ